MKRFALSEVMRSLPVQTLPLVEGLVAAARSHDRILYLVGGPVRDLLLGRPIRDVDLIFEICARWDIEASIRKVTPADVRIVRHPRFGTLSIEAGQATVDLAVVRRESYPRPGALPRVEVGTLEEDLRRRDFSVNAIALPLGDARGDEKAELIDPEEGLRDLEERRLRILHARSFHDDPTRALRAARLGPRLGFTLTRGSRASLRDAIRDGVFGAVSGDRLRREIEKLFADAVLGLDPAVALRRLAEWHVLPALEPGLGLPREAAAPLRRLGRATATLLWSGARVRVWTAGLALWFSPLAASLRRRALRRFSVQGERFDRIAGFPKARDAWLRALARARGRGAVDAVLGGIDEDRLFALHASATPAIRRRIVRWAVEDRSRRSPVSGSDLVALGVTGPATGRALARVRAAYLDGAVANREEAFALARELAQQRSITPRNRAANRRR